MVRSSPDEPADARSPREARGRVTEGPAGRPPAFVGGSNFLASGSLETSVEPIADGYLVDAHFAVQDNRPGSTYVWCLRVHEKAMYDRNHDVKPVFEHIDTDQIIAVPQAKPVELTFRKFIRPELKPGDYVVEVSAARLSVGMSIKRVRNSEHWWGLAQARATDRLRITEKE